MQTAPRYQFRSAAARAFTLIEVLIVIGLIGLLTALAVIGFKVVSGASKSRVTTTALENCTGLLETYKLTSSVDKLLDQTTVDKIVTAGRWETPAAGQANSVSACQITPPGVTAANAVRNTANREIHERLLRDETARIVRRLMTSSENRKSIEAMSADRVLRVKYPTDPAAMPTGTPLDYTTATPTVEGVVLTDADGKPIYFVPGGGLIKVNVGFKGATTTGDRADPNNYDRPNTTVVAPDRGPFWASPGPDGDLTTGDDNVYSFDGK